MLVKPASAMKRLGAILRCLSPGATSFSSMVTCEMVNSRMARVIPTYNSRRCSANSEDSCDGKTPYSTPMFQTNGNSRPFEACGFYPNSLELYVYASG